MESKLIHPRDSGVFEFMHEYLIDCIRFLVFFENYMKADLIVRGYCVHFIDKCYPGFNDLAKDQYSRPIKLNEINEIENFIVDEGNRVINHPAIKDKTNGIKELISKEQYYLNYEFDGPIIKIISRFNRYRNRLHFNKSIEYELSSSFISDIMIMNYFVDRIIRERTDKTPHNNIM